MLDYSLKVGEERGGGGCEYFKMNLNIPLVKFSKIIFHYGSVDIIFIAFIDLIRDFYKPNHLRISGNIVVYPVAEGSNPGVSGWMTTVASVPHNKRCHTNKVMLIS